MNNMTIAIDGPAGSGKSTIGNLLAQSLRFTFVDSGKIYRAIAKEILNCGIRLQDETAVVNRTNNLEIETVFSIEHERLCILIQDEDIARIELHTPEIDYAVPIVAAYPGVRNRVREIQRQIAKKGKVILAGRDIGTVVLPEADVKVFLDVGIEERVRRRFESLKNDPSITKEIILQDLIRRDGLDMTRDESPLKIPKDAIVISTDGMTPVETVKCILTKLNMQIYPNKESTGE